MPTQTTSTILVRPEQGIEYNLPNETMNFKLLSKDTQGQFAVTTSVIRPGGGPPPHIHEREDELWFIIDGTFEFLANGEPVVARAGDIIYSPRGNRHTFKNIGETDGHMFMVVTGSNFEQFYPIFAAAANEDPENLATLVQIAADYGMQLA